MCISLRDVQTLLWGFGVRSQLYRTREGFLDGTFKVDWQGEILIRRTRKEIYNLYRSTEKKEEGDSALPFADGPGAWRRSLLWFTLKHGFKILLLISAVVGISGVAYSKLRDPRSNAKKSVVRMTHNADIDSIDDIDTTVYSENGIFGNGWSVINGQYQDSSSSGSNP